VRNKTLRRFYDPTVAALEIGDQLVVVRQAVPDA
jgi:voltage-gated potassium channel